MADNASSPLVLFSGLAADERVFLPQKLAFPNLIVPAWPRPAWDDSLDSYSARLADSLAKFPRPLIGGASFGGIVALHVAKYLNPRAVLLIGSVKSAAELPRVIRISRPFKSIIRCFPVRLMQFGLAPLTMRPASSVWPRTSGIVSQFCGADPTIFKWSLARILDWEAVPKPECPVFHIHGDRDSILPMRYTTPDVVIHGGGHLISLTHSSQVNEFIRSAMKQLSQTASDVPPPKQSS